MCDSRLILPSDEEIRNAILANKEDPQFKQVGAEAFLEHYYYGDWYSEHYVGYDIDTVSKWIAAVNQRMREIFNEPNL